MICRLSCIYYREELRKLPHSSYHAGCYILNPNLIRLQWTVFVFSIVNLVREVGYSIQNCLVQHSCCVALWTVFWCQKNSANLWNVE